MPKIPPKTKAIRELIAMLLLKDATKIKGYPLYYCDRSGNIYNRWGHKLILNDYSSYYLVCVSKGDGKFKYKSVHRLVAETFIPNPNNLPQVNHKDGNKHNNAVDNLEWVSRSENQSHRFRELKQNHFGEKNPKSKLTAKEVLEIVDRYAKGNTSQSKLAKDYGVSVSTIWGIIRGLSWNLVTGIPPTRIHNIRRIAELSNSL